MNIILGNNTNIRAHIELIRPLPDNQTEVSYFNVKLIYRYIRKT